MRERWRTLGVGALIGLVAAGVAIGTAELVAGIVNPAASPILTVGQSAIDATPEWLKSLAIRTFGENDKTVLLGGIGATLLLAAVALGVASVLLLLVGLVGNALVILVWLSSRATGLPIGPEAGAPEPAAFVDVFSTILEVAIVAGTAMLVLRGRPTPSMRGLPVRLGLAVLVIALAVLTTWSVAAGATSEGEHGIDHGDHGDHGEAASSGRPGFSRVNLGDGGWSARVLVDAS